MIIFIQSLSCYPLLRLTCLPCQPISCLRLSLYLLLLRCGDDGDDGERFILGSFGRGEDICYDHLINLKAACYLIKDGGLGTENMVKFNLPLHI